MAVQTLAEHIRDELGERVLGTDVAYDQLTVTVDPGSFPQVARFCKNDLGMTFFDFLSAVDEREEGFSIVVRVYNHVKRTSVILKTMVPGGREEPKVSTLTGVYAGANWHERETYDMFGIIFEGHPGLLPRILTVENFEGWPLRKEFKLASRVVKPWPGAKEPADSSDDGDKKEAKPESAKPAEPEDRAAAAKAKAERAKKKAAAARKRKAEERAAAEAAETTPARADTGSEPDVPLPPPDAAEAAEARTSTEDIGSGAVPPPPPPTPSAETAEAAEAPKTGGGGGDEDVVRTAAATAVAGGTPDDAIAEASDDDGQASELPAARPVKMQQDPTEDSEEPADGDAADVAESEPDGPVEVPDSEEQTVDDAEPGSAREAAAAAAGMETDAHTPDPTTPEGASKIADTAAAKDAAAGTTVGDEVASGEQPASDEPKLDPEAEAAAGAAGADDADDADEETPR